MRPISFRRRLLPDGACRVAAIVAPMCLTVTAGLGGRYRGGDEPGHFDQVVDGLLRSDSPWWHRPLWALVELGDPRVFVVTVATVATAAVAVARWEALPLIVIAPLASAAVTEFVLKPGIGRTLSGGWTYPSGHTVAVTSLAAVLVILLIGARRPISPRTRLALGAGAVAVAVAVAVALVALGLHYATDIIGGVCLAFGIAFLVALLSDLWAVMGVSGRPVPISPANPSSK